jgi:hypothetical protein
MRPFRVAKEQHWLDDSPPSLPREERLGLGGRMSRCSRVRSTFKVTVMTETCAKTHDGKAHDGKVVSVVGDKLTTTCNEGKQHCHTMAKEAQVTCDGKANKAADLKAGRPRPRTISPWRRPSNPENTFRRWAPKRNGPG